MIEINTAICRDESVWRTRRDEDMLFTCQHRIFLFAKCFDTTIVGRCVVVCHPYYPGV